MKKTIRYIILIVMLTCIAQLVPQKAQAASVASVRIINAQSVQYTATLSAIPASDDGFLYLYELPTYVDAVAPTMVPIAAVPITPSVNITFDLFHKLPTTRLYSKFVICTKVGGIPVMVNLPQYITNPEALATHNRPRVALNKTLQNQSITNVIINGSGISAPACTPVVVMLAKNGTAVTHPMCAAADSHPVSYQYCMFNAANQTGVNGLVADMTFQAANSLGQDFIIGNEVHERQWNYMAYTDWNSYVKAYAQAFRVCYNAIKSENSNAKVYISLGQNWNRDRTPDHKEYYSYIDAKDFVDKFNAEIMAGGNIDWSIAIHPYTVPLTYAKFWDMSGQPDGAFYASQIITNKMVSFQNLSVETNYLANFRNPAGKPRTMFISEIGLSNTLGDEVQAAAIAASWMAYKRNPYISGYMYLSNIGDGVDSRLIGKGAEMYNALGTANEAAMLNWAKSYIGISDWSQILR